MVSPVCSPVETCQYCHEGFDFGVDKKLYRGCDCLHALTTLWVSYAGSYNVAESTSIQHELQEKVRRCRGKQGLIFTSAGRLSVGVKGNVLLHCMPPCCACMTIEPYTRQTQLPCRWHVTCRGAVRVLGFVKTLLGGHHSVQICSV